MLRFLATAQLGIVLIGCVESPSSSSAYDSADSAQQRYEKALAVGVESKLVKSFDYFSTLTRIVDDASQLTLYEGVPREDSGSQSKVIERDGYGFLESPLSIPEETLHALKELLAAEKTFYPFGGVKLCGGFHPDYCLVAETDHGPLNLHLCFGCAEMKVFQNGQIKLYCDFRNNKEREIESLLFSIAIKRAASVPLGEE